jgi:phosphohistidine swiveling domain-containing protein
MKYEKHQREYNLVSITAVIEAMVSRAMHNMYGTTLRELYSSVIDGAYFHILPEDSRKHASLALFAKIERGDFDMDQQFSAYKKEVVAYRALINTAVSGYSPELFIAFCEKYIAMLPIFFAGLDPIDFIDELGSTHHDSFRRFAVEVREVGETTYKDGEQTFIPAFLEWFSKYHTIGYTTDQLRYLVYTELIAHIRDGATLPSSEQLDTRRQQCLVHQYEFGQMHMWVGAEASQQLAKITIGNELGDISAITELKGKTAQQGKIRGPVCIVKTRADMEKFRDGGVIVSEMTDPSFLPIMKKASAFVTDEGGFLCHAAIVARELGVPCVIGTRFATQVFKDGDMVEVDADKGLVKILN